MLDFQFWIYPRLLSEFHYNYMKPKFGDRVKVLMTDTDEREIMPDVYARFDTSDFIKNLGV